MKNSRKPDYPLHPLFINRWSPRAMSGGMITREELMILFEAARWAPSSFNNQPWRFIYGFNTTNAWDKLFSLLDPFNKAWVTYGSVLILVISHSLFAKNNKPSRTHSFDTGAAWENLALQGSLMNLVVHGMEGFDYQQARATFALPKEYAVEAMLVIGKHGSQEHLPQGLQEREFPSDRKTVDEFAFEGQFKLET
jgi:nitroreductase